MALLEGSVCGLPQRNVVYGMFQLRTVFRRPIDLAPKTGVSVLQVAFSHHCVLTSLVARWRSNMTIAQGPRNCDRSEAAKAKIAIASAISSIRLSRGL